MNNVRSVLIGLVGLLLTTQLAFVSSASAQTSTEAERARLNRVMDANTNIEEFRQELTNYFTELEDAVRLYDAIPAVHRKYVKSGLRPMEMLAETKAKIAQISSEELSKMRTIYAGFTGWREAPRAAAALLKPELRGMLDTKLAVQQNGSPSPAFVTPDDCALAIATDVSNSDIAIAKGFEIAAETVMESLPTDFLSFEAHAVAAVARGVLQAISLGLETSKSIKDDCTALSSTDVQSIVTTAKTDIINNDNGNATTIVNNDNSNKVMILTNLDTKTTTITTAITNAKTDIVNNDNANKAMIVDSGNAGTTALSDLILRSQIEADRKSVV